jgi:hypothetical protein
MPHASTDTNEFCGQVILLRLCKHPYPIEDSDIISLINDVIAACMNEATSFWDLEDVAQPFHNKDLMQYFQAGPREIKELLAADSAPEIKAKSTLKQKKHKGAASGVEFGNIDDESLQLPRKRNRINKDNDQLTPPIKSRRLKRPSATRKSPKYTS